MFPCRAFETRFNVFGPGRPFFKRLVFTFWIIILHQVLPICCRCGTDARNQPRLELGGQPQRQ